MVSLNRLNKRVRVEQNTPTRSTSGEAIDAWTLYVVAHASLQPVSGGERFRGHQVHAEANTVMMCRHSAAPLLTPAMRIVWNGKTYDILAALNVGEENREWKLDLRERGLG